MDQRARLPAPLNDGEPVDDPDMQPPLESSPSDPPPPRGEPSSPASGEPRVGSGAGAPEAGTNLAMAGLLLVASAVVVFAAGLILGGAGVGRDPAEQAAVDAFVEAWRRIETDYVGESDADERLEGAIRGMFETLDDPYSAYLDAEEFSSTFDEIRGELQGIGAIMGVEDNAGGACSVIEGACRLRVMEVLPGTPASAAGLEAGDIVSAVDGQDLEGLPLDDAVLLIRGPRDTAVRLTLSRGDEDLELEVTRSVIRSQDVRTATLMDGRIGYLRVDSFSGSAADSFETALRDHLDGGVRELVLDLRDDPGGFVDAAVDIASQFIAEGPVFWEEDADGVQRAVAVEDGGLATDPEIELVVLVNGGTASASEILAGALQDAGRATLVGETTFGKGTVQEWTQLADEQGGFRLSIAKWLTRGKDWVHEVGLQPNVAVEDGGAGPYRPALGRSEVGADALAADPPLRRAVDLLLGEAGPGAGASSRLGASPTSSDAP